MPHLMAASGESIIHNSNTQKDSSASMVGGDEYRQGGDDLDAAKRGGFNFDEF